MSSEAMKAVFDNLTSGASRRAELEFCIDSAAHNKADSIEVSVKINEAEHANACHRLG